MTKYKIVGLINIFLGVIQLIASISQLSLNTKLGQLYTDFNVPATPNLIVAKIGVIGLLIFSLLNLFFGVKGVSGGKKKELYLKHGLILAIASFIICAFAVIFLIVTIILPIYSLNQQF